MIDIATSNLSYSDFIQNVFPPYQKALTDFHEELLNEGVKLKITEAKNGHVVSYLLDKHTLFNYVFRKSGLQVRLYAENAALYLDTLAQLPECLEAAITKAGDCKACNSRCPKGYVFTFRGEAKLKCRYGILLPVNDETITPIMGLIQRELLARKAA